MHTHSNNLPLWLQILTGCYVVIAGWFLIYALIKFAEARQNRPEIAKKDIVYQEWFASGRSLKNLLTKLGNNNSLRLIVTEDRLIVTSWFPLTLFSAAFDLEQTIPLNGIASVERRRVLFSRCFRIVFTDRQGVRHTLDLLPKRPEAFLKALKIAAD